MEEVEVKFLDIDKKAVIAKLEALGAEKVFEGEIIPSFFDYPGDPLRAKDQILRLRKKGDETELAFKQKKNYPEAKVAEETELNVDDFEIMKKILLKLGMVEVVRHPKHRISYRLDGAQYEIDEYDGIPAYIEIETSSIETLKKAVEKIGFHMKDSKPWSGRQLLRHYKKD
ncbi:class IV adenylate cyclase [Candidatus Woesearchaeota archaeon]|nr:class IV adenylate cyclase [Candidatus Woesearchaeota archaeon]